MKKVIKFIICFLLAFCLLSPVASFATSEEGESVDESATHEASPEGAGAEIPEDAEEDPLLPDATDEPTVDETPGDTVEPDVEETPGDTVEPDADTIPEENLAETDEPAGAGKETIDTYTLFGRLWEFAEENSAEVMNFISGAAILIFGLFSKAASKKDGQLIKDSLSLISHSSSRTANSQNSVIDVVNTMSDGYNEMRDYYERLKDSEDDRNRLIGAVAIQNTAILEILSAVYVHNKNLPQGVKDLVVLKYANCMKALNDDEVLREVTESVREIVNKRVVAETQEQTEMIAESVEV